MRVGQLRAIRIPTSGWIDVPRFVRFLATGLVNTGFGYAVFVVGLLVGLQPATALAMQFALGIPFNFLVHGRYVFGPKGTARLPAYALAYLALYGVNLWLLGLLIPTLAASAAQALLLLPMAGLSFIVLSRVMR